MTVFPSRSARPGMVLLELVVSLGIMLFFLVAFAQLLFGFTGDARVGAGQTQAAYYGNEGLEAVRSIARRNFDELRDGVHGLSTASGYYAFSGSTDARADFVRSVTIASVERDAFGNIVPAGGVVDQDTKAVTSTVTWNAGGVRPLTVSLLTYLTRWPLGHWVIDMFDDFQGGARNGTLLTQAGNGEVQMEQRGDMTKASTWLTASVAGSPVVTDIQVDTSQDLLYLSTLQNAWSGEFLAFDISDVSQRNVSLVRSVDLGVDARAFAIDGQYAYILTSARNLRVLRLSDFVVVSTWTIPQVTSMDGINIDTSTHRAYLVAKLSFSASSTLLVFDISHPTAASPTLLSTVPLPGAVASLSVDGNYAFMGTSETHGEIVVENLRTMGAPVSCDLPGTTAVTRVREFGNQLYVGRVSGNTPQFAVYGLRSSNPADCTYMNQHILGTTDLGSGDVYSLEVNPTIGNAFMTLSGGPKVAVVDLVTFTSSIIPLAGLIPCNDLLYLGSTLYVGCPAFGQTLQVLRGDLSGYQAVYSEGTQNGWIASDQNGNVSNRLNTFLPHTGNESLLVRAAANGSTTFSKGFRTAMDGSLDFYVNTVSPWAFGVYGGNAGSPDATTTVSNPTYGSAFATNVRAGAFTTFPVADYDGLKALAQTTSSYFDEGHSHETFTASDLAAFHGKVVFVDFADNGKRLVIDLGNAGGSYNVSFVVRGGKGIVFQNYRGATLTAADATLPLFVTNGDVHLSSDDSVTLNGTVFAEGEVESSALNGTHRLTINGSVVAGRVDGSLEHGVITYNSPFQITPPRYFSPTYSGQDIVIQASAGMPVHLSQYAPGGIDADPATWQFVSIPLSDMQLTRMPISWLRFQNPSGVSQPSYFIDDLGWVVGEEPYTLWATFTSPSFDGGNGLTWHDLSWYANGVVTLRVRTADTQAHLANALWVGPDGTSSTVYAQSGGELIRISPQASGSRWAQWKAYFSGDGASTPVLDKVTLRFQ